MLAYKEIPSTENSQFMDEKKVAQNLRFLALIGIHDELREGVVEVLDAITKSHIDVRILTGDDIQTAISTAKQLNLHSN